MIRTRVLAHLAVGLAAWAIPVDAACTWTWDCSGGAGQCVQVPICNSSLDIPPPRPPQVAPIAPPTVAPVPTPNVNAEVILTHIPA